MKALNNPSFRYIPSSATDIRLTFARVRAEAARLSALEQARSAAPVPPTLRLASLRTADGPAPI